MNNLQLFIAQKIFLVPDTHLLRSSTWLSSREGTEESGCALQTFFH